MVSWPIRQVSWPPSLISYNPATNTSPYHSSYPIWASISQNYWGSKLPSSDSAATWTTSPLVQTPSIGGSPIGSSTGIPTNCPLRLATKFGRLLVSIEFVSVDTPGSLPTPTPSWLPCSPHCRICDLPTKHTVPLIPYFALPWINPVRTWVFVE